QHHTVVIDALARAGRLQEAQQYLRKTVPNDVVAHSALLGGCRTHANAELGREAFDALMRIPQASAADRMAALVSMQHIYQACRRPDEVQKLEEMRLNELKIGRMQGQA